MRKLLLSSAFALLGYLPVQAQCTPIASLNHNGWYPSNLPQGYTESPYDEYISFKVPYDSNVVYSGFPITLVIDSTVVQSITGMPAGFIYTCGPSNPQNNRCSYNGGEKGCIRVQGNPVSGQEGVYYLELTATTYPKGMSPSTDTRTFKLGINYPVGTIESPNKELRLRQAYPQPATETLILPLVLNQAGPLEISISGVDGKELIRESHAGVTGENEIRVDIAALPAGIYFVEITLNNAIVRTKIQVQ